MQPIPREFRISDLPPARQAKSLVILSLPGPLGPTTRTMTTLIPAASGAAVVSCSPAAKLKVGQGPPHRIHRRRTKTHPSAPQFAGDRRVGFSPPSGFFSYLWRFGRRCHWKRRHRAATSHPPCHPERRRRIATPQSKDLPNRGVALRNGRPRQTGGDPSTRSLALPRSG